VITQLNTSFQMQFWGRRRADGRVRPQPGPRRSRPTGQPVARKPAGLRTDLGAPRGAHPSGSDRPTRVRAFQRSDPLLFPQAMGEFIIRAADPLGLRHPDVIASMSAPRQRCSLRPRDPGPAARPGHRQRRPVARSSSAACAEIGGCRSTPSPLTSGCPAALAGSGWAGPGSSSVPSGPTPSEECSEP
jgi:hypothetical protein